MSSTAPAISLEDLLEQAPPLTDARLHRIELRKSDPTWRFALAARASSPGFVLVLTSDQLAGYGSAGEIRHDLAHMREQITAALPALAHSRTDDEAAALAALTGPARALVHMALLDLVARSRGVAAHALLGTAVRSQVELTRILSLKSPPEMAAIALEHQREGYRHVKVKLDNEDNGAVDLARLRAIRDAVGPDFGITIDANQSYSPEEAVRFCERIDQFRVIVFEQPVPADDLDGLAYVTTRTAIPIEADEAASSLERVRQIAERGAANGVSIKIAKLGGLDQALTAANLCTAAGLDIRIGAHVGSRLLNAAALHLAVVLPALHEPAELAEFERLEGDPATGLEVRAGHLRVPDRVGLGVDVDLPDDPASALSA
jgi:L-alanine-DL-glutamate epimerase-like enolase superfamily enzyme